MSRMYVVINDIPLSNPYSVTFINDTARKVILREGDSEIELDGFSRFLLWGIDIEPEDSILSHFQALQGDIFVSIGGNKGLVEKIDSGLILRTNFETLHFTSEKDMQKFIKYGYSKIGNIFYGEYRGYSFGTYK